MLQDELIGSFLLFFTILASFITLEIQQLLTSFLLLHFQGLSFRKKKEKSLHILLSLGICLLNDGIFEWA